MSTDPTPEVSTGPTPEEFEAKVYARLKDIRQRTDLELKPNAFLRKTIVGLDGSEEPLNIRYYQIQGIFHLAVRKRFVLGDDTGLGKCPAKGTLILTDRGLVPIESLGPDGLAPDTFVPVQGWKVFVDGKARPVKRFYYGGHKPTVKLRTRRGFALEGSRIHPILVRRADGSEDFVRLPDLRLGDFVCVERKEAPFPMEDPLLLQPDPREFAPHAALFDLPLRLNPELARLFGYVVSEGWTNGSGGMFSIAQDLILNPEVRSDIESLVKEQFGYDASGQNGDSVQVSSCYLFDFLRVNGMTGELSRGKHVPSCIMGSSRSTTIAFLKGLLDAESSMDNLGVLEFSSSSQRLAHEVHLLLLRLGIVGSLNPKRIKGNPHTYWRLTITGDDLRRYQDVVGMVSTRKIEALSRCCARKSNPNLDIVPHSKALVEDLRADIYARAGLHGFKGAGISTRWGTAFFNTLQHVRQGRRSPSRAFLYRMLDIATEVGVGDTKAANAVRTLLGRGFFYDPITFLGDSEAEVMDIEVDDPGHSFIGNGLVNHNTLMTIAGMCFAWGRSSKTKAVVMTTKSAAPQWAKEIQKFADGIRVFHCVGTPQQRKKVRDEFLRVRDDVPTVLIMGYRTACVDFTHWQNLKDFILVFDEATAFKTPGTLVHKVCADLARRALYCWGLTATIIKNNLIEGYGIYKVILPHLFGSLTNFQSEFCIMRPRQIGYRQVLVFEGHFESQIKHFREIIDPFFLGRPKFEVAKDLPPLSVQNLEVELSKAEWSKYKDALDGLLEVGKKDGSNELEEKAVTKLTAVTYCQQIVNHLGLIGQPGESSKLAALVELLTEGDFADEKVIVFSRFRGMIDLIAPALQKVGIESVRVTGSEDSKQRMAAMEKFQDPKSSARVILLTMAGNEGINLQSAKALVFYDTPWSAGEYIQILGRMIRIGSKHDRVYAVHLIAKGGKAKTIDQRVMEIMTKKMGYIEQLIGKRIKGEGDSATVVTLENDLSTLFAGLVDDAKDKE